MTSTGGGDEVRTAPRAERALRLVKADESREASPVERELQTAQRRFAEAERIAKTGSYEVDLLTGEVTWSAEQFRILGMDPTVVVPTVELMLAIAHPDDLEIANSAFEAAALSGTPFDVTCRVTRADGVVIWVRSRGEPELGPDGTAVRLAGTLTDETQRLAAERVRRAAERRLGFAQRIAGIGTFEMDLITGDVVWSSETYRLLGLDSAVVPSVETFMGMVHLKDLARFQGVLADAVKSGTPIDDVTLITHPDGRDLWIRCKGEFERSPDGTLVKLNGAIVDETAQRSAQRIREEAETGFETAFEQAALGAVIADLEGYPTRVNPAYCALLGRPAAILTGRRWTDSYHPEEIPLRQVVLARLAAGHDTYQGERRYLRPDGSLVWALVNATLVRDGDAQPNYLFMQFQDITDRKAMEEQLGHQLLHDELTGLPSRALLHDRLLHGLAGAKQRGKQLAVMFLDLDRLKTVNDVFGHAYGDDLLRYASDRIAGAIRPGDTVARFGGDEFVITCEDVSVAEAEHLAERVLASLMEPCEIRGRTVAVAASIGLAMAERGATPASLLRDSDAAMYRAKERGRGRVELFDDVLRAAAEERRATAVDLRLALERDEFVVHFQPVVDLATGDVVSAEALVRWNHPDRGVVGPDQFIPLAEDSGLIVPIGAWVLEESCRQLRKWQEMVPSISVAVNLSVRQVTTPGVVELIDDILRRTGVRPGDLCLELTESVFMDDVDYFGRTLAKLKALGVRLAIDDFGTGYSSLSYLKRFPIDTVKVDRAFVEGLGTDPNDSAIVAAIVAMADALKLEVVAEGIETREQFVGLKTLRCGRAQGFYLARPMSAEAMTQLVDHRSRLPVVAEDDHQLRKADGRD